MALTYSIVIRGTVGNRRQHHVDLTFDSSYDTGGEAITANGCGLSSIESVLLQSKGDGYVPEWDATNSKIKMRYVGAGGVLTEVTAATNLSAVVIRASVTGR